MNNEEYINRLYTISGKVRQLVKNDRITTTAVDVTALGIMELTRKKEEKSLREQVLELTGGEKH